MSDYIIFEDSPTLGKFIRNYPIDRLRMLIVGGVIMGVVWLIATVTLWSVEENIALPITTAVISVTGLGVGWGIVHFWNREVILYEKGFSYREGSRFASFAYVDIEMIRQTGEQTLYFGGLIKWSNYKFIMETADDDMVTLSSFYRRFDELTLRLENEITKELKRILDRRLGDNERVSFGQTVEMDTNCLYIDENILNWSDFAEFSIKMGALVISSKTEPSWASINLKEIENVRLLIDILKEKTV